MYRHNAFTLVELLVVIALIAILAALLFPVFAQAREKARAISCLSNEKQIGLAFQMYAEDYDEAFPLWNFAVFAPPGYTETSADCWDAKLLPYVKDGHPDNKPTAQHDYSGVWHCPDGEDGTRFRTYGVSYSFLYDYNSFGIRTLLALPQIDAPAHFIIVGETGHDPDTPMEHGPESNDGNAGLMDPPYYFSGYSQHFDLPEYNAEPEDRERPYRHNGGANYIFADSHAKFMRAEVVFPHPTPPADPNNATNAQKGEAHCAMANWFVPTASERDYHRFEAISLGYGCSISQ